MSKCCRKVCIVIESVSTRIFTIDTQLHFEKLNWIAEWDKMAFSYFLGENLIDCRWWTSDVSLTAQNWYASTAFLNIVCTTGHTAPFFVKCKNKTMLLSCDWAAPLPCCCSGCFFCSQLLFFFYFSFCSKLLHDTVMSKSCSIVPQVNCWCQGIIGQESIN